jgi:hypothetical protein
MLNFSRLSLTQWLLVAVAVLLAVNLAYALRSKPDRFKMVTTEAPYLVFDTYTGRLCSGLPAEISKNVLARDEVAKRTHAQDASISPKTTASLSERVDAIVEQYRYNVDSELVFAARLPPCAK